MGLEPPPNIPQVFKDCIQVLGGSEIKLVIQKSLQVTDLRPQQNCLSISLKQIRSSFLNEDEERIVSTMNLTKWSIRSSLSYIINGDYSKVLKNNRDSLKPNAVTEKMALEQIHLVDRVRALIATDPWNHFFSIIEPAYSELTLVFCLTFPLHHVMLSHDELHTISFRLDSTACYLSVPEFGAALGFCYEEFMSAEGFLTLYQHIYYSLSLCWEELTASTTSYDLSQLKATSLPSALSYIHAILAYTLIGQKESTGVTGTFDTYSL
ncbi:hypothetical protein Gogos_020078 [Gossypium gossypioides]|uniref:Uncharacterized protein n=1 Tax=Gossypium gossypioides TaxID=34282 RepID=A0A7J9D0G0_GOSGO|nr:hypothetical protein [Gossypium gossypioides]